MNKVIKLLFIAISLLSVSLSSYAQKGEKTLGIAGGYASHNEAGYADVYFQYTFAPHLRIAPELGYIFRGEGKSGFECSVDMQFPFRISRGFNFYPLAGLTLNNWSFKHGEHETRGGFDIGGGFDLYLTQSFKLNIQGKYSAMNDTSGLFLNLGIGYVF